MERAYVEQDLAGLTHNELTSLVERQKDKWPLTPGKIRKSNKNELKQKLLDPKLGFTTNQPIIAGAAEPPGPTIAGAAVPPPARADVVLTAPSDVVPSTETTTVALGINSFHFLSMYNPLNNLLAAQVMKSIQLLINDRRLPSFPINTSQRIDVRFINSDECTEGEWRANASEILVALQHSVGRLAGAYFIPQLVLLSLAIHPEQDRVDASYTEYFVEMTANDHAENFTTDPQLLIIPNNNRLNLRVDCVPGIYPESQSAETFGIQSLIQPVLLPPTFINAGTSGDTVAGTRSKQLPTNSERVAYWRFAFNAKQDLHKKPWPTEVSSSKARLSIWPCEWPRPHSQRRFK
ncbi:hypothetical protein B0H13DRAFT_1889352 [Mycena leptocephala]|nr:hypothetical protein B0H13DRAFT_1889352 [Mycena leptocephala]